MMLASRVALVTGAAQGIGLATVRQLLQSGAKVGLVDISNQLDKTCDVLRDEFGSKSVLSMPCDVTDDKSLRGVFEKTIDEFGSLDIVVNNAGIDNEQNWSKTIQVNLSAVIAGTYHALELMSPGGVIINVSSMAGLYPIPFGPTYSATKHGVVGFSRSMKDHDEIRKKNIRINVLCPYFAEVGMGQNSFDQIPEPYRSEIAKKGFVTSEQIVKGMMELINDTSKNGDVLKVTPWKGLTYHSFGERKAKL